MMIDTQEIVIVQDNLFLGRWVTVTKHNHYSSKDVGMVKTQFRPPDLSKLCIFFHLQGREYATPGQLFLD